MAKKSSPHFAARAGPVLHSARWRFGVFELDEATRELRRDGELIELEPKPLNMLMLMLRHPGELITKNDLMEALWTGRIVTESVLSNCVTKLRSALGDDERAPRIRNLHGYGYRLEAAPELITERLSEPEAPLFQVDSSVLLRPNWRLRRRLGLSGETWLAEQPHTGEQRVFKFAHTPRGLSSLKREVTLYRLLRQTLEDQAPVADLIDWNFDEPPWFIEVEYCALGSLNDWLESQGGARALPLDARLALVIQLAEALAAVHSVGILHKDLKPANVLVSPNGRGGLQLKLGDFGSGRLLDTTRLEALAITRLGFSQFADSTSSSSGTPLYYAPEVLGGQPTTLKADIYALGVIFYQLVVGDLRRLFAPGWEAGVEDALIREDIAAAAAGDPNLRLPDALLLAQRLRQLPARHEARARQQIEREAAAATALALHRAQARRWGLMMAVGALALGLVASLTLYGRAERARDAEALARQQAVASRDFLLSDVLGQLADGPTPAQRLTVQQLLTTAADKAGERFKDDPVQAAAALRTIGRALIDLGLREDASQALDSALVTLRPVATQDPSGYVLAAALLMGNEYNLNRFSRRAAEFADLHAFSKTLLPADAPALLRQYLALTMAAHDAGRLNEADAMVGNAVAMASQGGAEQAAMRAYLQGIQGRVQMALGYYPQAIANLRASLDATRQRLGVEQPETVLAQLGLAVALLRYGETAQAEKLLADALPIAKRLEPVAGELTFSVLQIGAEAALQRGSLAEAQTRWAAIEPLRAAAPHINRYDSHVFLARLALAQQQPQQALDTIHRLKNHVSTEESAAPHSLDDLVLTHLQIQALIDLGRLADAGQLFGSTPIDVLSSLPAAHELHVEQRVLEAQLLRPTKPEEAQRQQQAALKLCASALSPQHPRCRVIQQRFTTTTLKE